MHLLTNADPQNISDPRTDTICVAHEKMWTWTDVDAIPSI